MTIVLTLCACKAYDLLLAVFPVLVHPWRLACTNGVELFGIRIYLALRALLDRGRDRRRGLLGGWHLERRE
jgi:hypothetical protein